ncbi:MAG TPA: hypothetical protein DCR81_06550 [Smithella sp.]|jgi:hypothetical protein|nr:hypothetical protein [Smithella sp.]
MDRCKPQRGGPYAAKSYFFKGDQYFRYDWTTERIDAGYPQPLSAWNLPGVFTTGFDACLNGRGSYKEAPGHSAETTTKYKTNNNRG